MLRQAIKSTSRTAARSALRSQSQSLVARSAYKAAAAVAAPAQRQFHLSRPTFALSASDAELVSTLKKEIELETEQEENETESSVVDKFLSDSGFKVVAQEGTDLIELVKKEGGEVVHVYFSLFDIAGENAYENFEQDQEESGSAAEYEQEQDTEEFDDMENPIRAKIVIERPTGKALTVETTIHEDLFLIQYIQPHQDGKIATSNTAEADHSRRQQYQGPVYSTLDPNVQSAVERYLESRGINSEMAAFIVEYTATRENKEYISWLKQVKDIVEQE